MTSAPRIFDRDLYRQRLARAAKHYSRADFLKRRVIDDLAERLLTINRRFPVALELGSRTGIFRDTISTSPELAAKIGTLIESDLCPALLRDRSSPRLVLDEEHLPFASESADLVLAALSLHTVNDLAGCLARIRAILKPDGLFLGVFYGADTLVELRQALMQAETETTGGAGLRIAPVLDVRDGGAVLQYAGFALPAVDQTRETVRYDQVRDLLRDLRHMGETSVLDSARKPLRRATLGRLDTIYQEQFSDPDGRIRATVSTITLTGWAPHPGQQKPLKPGSGKAHLSEVLGSYSDTRRN